jgi:hypothetical protein
MKKKKETELVKKQEITPEEKQKRKERYERLLKDPNFFIDEEGRIEKLENIYSSEKEDPDLKENKAKLTTELSYMFNLENGVVTANLSHHRYSPALARMRQRIIKDYDCKDSLELMLADSIVANYWRLMRYERVSNLMCEQEDGNWNFNQLKINLLKEVNKGLELANRHMGNNIILLKEMKQPKLSIKVKTDNAYFAQNQQVINKDSLDKAEKPLEANDLGKI